MSLTDVISSAADIINALSFAYTFMRKTGFVSAGGPEPRKAAPVLPATRFVCAR